MNTTLNQNSYGNGDNVAGNLEKHFHAILPESLISLVDVILSNLQNRELDQALHHISVIDKMGNKDSEVNFLIELLRIKCEIITAERTESKISDLNRIITSSKSELIIDLALSIILRFESSEIFLATERYHSSAVKGVLSRSVYFELLAEFNEIQEKYTSHKFTLSEYELIGIILGSFNKGEFLFAAEVSQHLSKNYQSYNVDVLMLFSKAFLLNDVLANVHYWLISSDQKEQVDSIADKTYQLIEQSNGKDIRLFNIAIPIFRFTTGFSNSFSDMCYKYISSIEKLDPELADDLKASYDKSYSNINNHISKMRLISSSTDLYNVYISEVSSKKTLTYNEFKFFEKASKNGEFIKWISSGGELYEPEPEPANMLLSIYLDIYLGQYHNLDRVFETLSSEVIEPSEINISFIYDLASKLHESKFCYYAAKLISSFVKFNDCGWCSPVAEVYCFSLYNAGQFSSLVSIIDKIDESSWGSELYVLNIQTLLYHEMHTPALELCNKAIERFPEHILFYSLKFNCLTVLNLSLPDFVDSLGVGLFSLCNDSLQFLVFLHDKGFYSLVEQVIVRWYIDNPFENSRVVSQACLNFSNFQHHSTDSRNSFVPSSSLQGVICGVVYTDSGKDYTKLIVSENKNPHETIILKDSPLGKTLLIAEQGVKTNVNGSLKQIILKEKLPPYVAVYRLSMEIRGDSNDGTDMFQSYSVPSDPMEILDFLKDNLPNQEFDNDLAGNADYPLNIRAHRYLPSDPSRAAIAVLTDERFSKKDLFSNGLIDTSEIYVDLVTIFYLALTSLHSYVCKGNMKIYTSRFALGYINDWIDKIENDKFMTLGQDAKGQVFINTSKIIKYSSPNLIPSLREISRALNVPNPILGNEPKEISLLREILEPSLRDVLYHSFTNSLPLLSVDSQLCYWLSCLPNIKVCNAYKFFEIATSSIPYSEREAGLVYHLQSDMPYAFLTVDFSNIAKSKSSFSGTLLFLAIKKHSDWIVKNTIPEKFLALIFMQYFYSEFQRNNWNLAFAFNNASPQTACTEKMLYLCCDLIIANGKKNYAEERVSDFIINMLHFIRDFRVLEVIRTLLLNYLIGRFMDLGFINKCINKSLNKNGDN